MSPAFVGIAAADRSSSTCLGVSFIDSAGVDLIGGIRRIHDSNG